MTKAMTDVQKIEALTELLGNVINALELKQYEIEDATESYKCEVEADEYYSQMMSILHEKDYVGTFFGTPITQQQSDELDTFIDTLGNSEDS